MCSTYTVFCCCWDEKYPRVYFYTEEVGATSPFLQSSLMLSAIEGFPRYATPLSLSTDIPVVRSNHQLNTLTPVVNLETLMGLSDNGSDISSVDNDLIPSKNHSRDNQLAQQNYSRRGSNSDQLGNQNSFNFY